MKHLEATNNAMPVSKAYVAPDLSDQGDVETLTRGEGSSSMDEQIIWGDHLSVYVRPETD